MSNPSQPARAGARYDLAALRPPAPCSGNPDPDPATWQHLQRWCQEGSGPGGSPLWAPRALPSVEQRLSVAQLRCDDAGTASRLAAQLMLERDGSLQLLACNTAMSQLALRLKTRLHDLMWWRQRQPSDPWDSGYVIDTPAGVQALSRFMPRRATLLVAAHMAPDTLSAVLDDLHSRQARFACPVRVLVLGPMPATPAAQFTAIDVAPRP